METVTYQRLQKVKELVASGYTIKEACFIIKLGQNTFYQLIRREKLREKYKHISSPGNKIDHTNKNSI